MAKYPKKAQEKIKENLHSMKQGKLEIGSGHTVTNPKQALSALVYPKSEKGVLRYLRIKNKIVFIPNEKWNLSGVKYKMISSYCILGNGGNRNQPLIVYLPPFVGKSIDQKALL